jgi:hypothetical protein
MTLPLRRDICDDVVAIQLPLPDSEPDPYTDQFAEPEWQEAAAEAADEVRRERQAEAEHLRVLRDEAGQDPLLSALEDQRRAKEIAERRIRELIAYGREFVQPRPYTLDSLAKAAGMSISGIRTAYDHAEVAAVSRATGAKSREWRPTDAAVVSDPVVVPDVAAWCEGIGVVQLGPDGRYPAARCGATGTHSRHRLDGGDDLDGDEAAPQNAAGHQ